MGANNSILWIGDLTLEQLRWTLGPPEITSTPLDIEEEQKIHWKQMLKQYPHLYDGDLLLVKDCKITKEQISLILSPTKFSLVTFYYEKKIPFQDSLGSLGFQCVVLDKNRTAFLIGERAHTSDYQPGWFTVPGGIFEKEDVEGRIQEACLRELTEEVKVKVKEETLKLRAIIREQNDMGVILFTEIETNMIVPKERTYRTKIRGNEEWEKNELKWVRFDEIPLLPSNRLMEGLEFLKHHQLYG